MRRIFLIFLLELYFGAFAYSSIAPHHAQADPYSTNRRIVTAALVKKTDTQNNNKQTTIILIATQSTTFFAQDIQQEEQATQNSLRLPWPSINIPDLSFLWKQQRSDQQKDIYDRGQ